LQTRIGSDGIALSGGESQRLAVARSLYHDPEFLILDEPTSALDPVLSKRLLTQLVSPDFKKTVVVVTHDWEALPVFNKIAVLDKGRLIGVGSYDELEPVIAQLQMREARG
jgi:ABC-type transport system involved in cytochrome bd biosynthesis fused ATPase/permease subunit